MICRNLIANFSAGGFWTANIQVFKEIRTNSRKRGGTWSFLSFCHKILIALRIFVIFCWFFQSSRASFYWMWWFFLRIIDFAGVCFGFLWTLVWIFLSCWIYVVLFIFGFLSKFWSIMIIWSYIWSFSLIFTFCCR